MPVGESLPIPLSYLDAGPVDEDRTCSLMEEEHAVPLSVGEGEFRNRQFKLVLSQVLPYLGGT
jgi:hypothetical protein